MVMGKHSIIFVFFHLLMKNDSPSHGISSAGAILKMDTRARVEIGKVVFTLIWIG